MERRKTDVLRSKLEKLVEHLENGTIHVQHLPKRLRRNLVAVLDNLDSAAPHTWEQRDDDLASCTVCGGGEGSLPTHCPGTRMSSDEADDVYAGRLDFKNGKWEGVLPVDRWF